jgi:hypothetical protein
LRAELLRGTIETRGALVKRSTHALSFAETSSDSLGRPPASDVLKA